MSPQKRNAIVMIITEGLYFITYMTVKPYMKTLLNRAAEPQEIVDLCLFLASSKGQFINGENIMIDGGRNAMGRWN